MFLKVKGRGTNGIEFRIQTLNLISTPTVFLMRWAIEISILSSCLTSHKNNDKKIINTPTKLYNYTMSCKHIYTTYVISNHSALFVDIINRTYIFKILIEEHSAQKLKEVACRSIWKVTNNSYPTRSIPIMHTALWIESCIERSPINHRKKLK